MKDIISEYATDRDAAIVECINTDSLDAFKAFVTKYQDKRFFPACFELPSDAVLEISIRQMCLHCTSIEPEIKGRAVDWLTSRGHHLDFTD